MRTYTAHVEALRPPVLIPEGWSWGAAIFGPLWLLAHRAWIPAALWLACWGLIVGLAPGRLGAPLLFGLFLISGLLGRDAVRWSLARRGYVLAHVLAARDRDAALARLLAARPDLVETYLGRSL